MIAAANLIVRLRQNDQAAWGELVDDYKPRLLRFAHRRIRDLSTCEDIVQDALISFVQSVGSLDESRPVEGYLVRICGCRIADYLRKAYRDAEYKAWAAEEVRPVRENAAQGYLVTQREQAGADRDDERKAAIREAIPVLVERLERRGQHERARAVQMLFGEMAGTADVAAELGLATAKVASWRFESVESLRKIVAEMAVEAC